MVPDSENHASPVEHCDTIVLRGSDTREAKCQKQKSWITISLRDFSRLPIRANDDVGVTFFAITQLSENVSSLVNRDHAGGCGRAEAQV